MATFEQFQRNSGFAQEPPSGGAQAIGALGGLVDVLLQFKADRALLDFRERQLSLETQRVSALAAVQAAQAKDIGSRFEQRKRDLDIREKGASLKRTEKKATGLAKRIQTKLDSRSDPRTRFKAQEANELKGLLDEYRRINGVDYFISPAAIKGIKTSTQVDISSAPPPPLSGIDLASFDTSQFDTSLLYDFAEDNAFNLPAGRYKIEGGKAIPVNSDSLDRKTEDRINLDSVSSFFEGDSIIPTAGM